MRVPEVIWERPGYRIVEACREYVIELASGTDAMNDTRWERVEACSSDTRKEGDGYIALPLIVFKELVASIPSSKIPRSFPYIVIEDGSCRVVARAAGVYVVEKTEGSDALGNPKWCFLSGTDIDEIKATTITRSLFRTIVLCQKGWRHGNPLR